MSIILVKRDGKDNISKPKKEGDVGFDMKASSIEVKGLGYNLMGDIVTECLSIHQLQNIKWQRINYIQYGTNIRIQPEKKNLFSIAVSNSRVTKQNLILGNSLGIIDNGYNGEIILRYKYIIQPEDLSFSNEDKSLLAKINLDYIFNIGDVIGQLVFAESLIPDLHFIENLNTTERGDNGFGSTQR